MKKILIYISAIIILFFLTQYIIEFLYEGHIIENEKHTPQINEIPNENTEKQSNKTVIKNNKYEAEKTQMTPEITERPPSGVSMVSLKDLQLPSEIINEFENKLKLLKNSGSISGGVLTHEFLSLNEMKKALQNKSLEKQKAELAIQPTNLIDILGEEYKLIGANTQAKYIPDKGWTGFFQIIENQYSNVMMELSEDQIETHAGDGTQIISEFMNDEVSGKPATVEVIKLDKGGNVYNISWSAGDRLFKISTKNISRQEALNIANEITNQFQRLPNDGWKEPYILDVENNPLHRQYKLR